MPSASPSRTTESAGPSMAANVPPPFNTTALQHELELMADVRAYFDIAHQRILDDVQRAIDLKFLYGFCDGLQEFMAERLALGAADAKTQCVAYLAEDPSDAAKREALLSQKKLESAMKTLNAFGL
ncbi:hypothetical protein C8Q80DRAFT_958773 [Daedaleopsis nitida]|nr:hypothetical protein C8Q80DRAFT_958773 [Daedaleopsis nitida]